ncbi:uncharacterized protein LOC141587660 [Silene latifolia]|uniref:uncharacterized protein LOC141587660 n=1 Tax=Silene latifolia TaxID=37657 RepID=UPI003D774E02
MAIILRFVDRGGLLRERFFKVVKVTDTCSQTLMNEIVKAFTQYNLQLENIRGQGYDGANNMRGQFNGLQALFQRECPYAYYVQCFAHRHSMLKALREEEISELVAAGTLKTGSGKNQATTLQRAGATRWGSHLRSISSLIKLFTATRSTIDDLYLNGTDKVRGEAKAVGKALTKFDFVFCLLMMHDIMKTTDFLCQALQRKDTDILNALHSLVITKEKLKDMRENGRIAYWEDFRWKNLIPFTDSSKEILTLGASFDPRHNFRAFKSENVCKLALKYYPSDFSSNDMRALDLECGLFVADIQKDPRFENTTSVSDLCRRWLSLIKVGFIL